MSRIISFKLESDDFDILLSSLKTDIYAQEDMVDYFRKKGHEYSATNAEARVKKLRSIYRFLLTQSCI